MSLNPHIEEIKSMQRPDRDALWMGMAFYMSMMSHDRESKNGAVIVNNRTNYPIGIGYLGFPRGCRDHELPSTRPEKYLYTQHAERNATLSVREPCFDATLYTTMQPCEVCVGTLLNQTLLQDEYNRCSGIRRIVFWESRSHPAAEIMLSHHPGIKVEQYTGNAPQDILRMAARYMDLRPQDGLYRPDEVTHDYSTLR